MAEALVSIVLKQLPSIGGQLASIGGQQAEERICLTMGAKQEVEKLQSNFQSIQAVLLDAENRQVKESAVRDWLYKLKDVSYDIDDVLDEWNTKIQKLQIKKAENASKPLKKVCSLILHYLSCRPIVLRYSIAVKIKSLNGKLDIITAEKDKFNFSVIAQGRGELERKMTTSVIDLKEVHGRDKEKNKIMKLLLRQSSEQQVLPIIISIVGMGGIGKTTLARLAFNDNKVKSQFDEKIWVCVSEPFDEIRISKAILESLTNNQRNLVELETVMRNIRQHIEGKKFLLVLDDVWTENPRDWDQLKDSLKCGSPESRILVTTRNENVANYIGSTNVISLGTLPEEKCWSLFRQVAFMGMLNEECENFKELGRKIVQKCKGLPLAIKTLGSLLRFKRKFEEWQDVLESKMWEIKEVEKGLFPPLLLSYCDLPPLLKKCFLYCAIFPKDYRIDKNQLIFLWMAQGYLWVEHNKDMKLVGEEYFEALAMRSFFQDFERSGLDDDITFCKMHDMVHDLAQFLTKKECHTIEVDVTRESELESSNIKVRHSMITIERGASFPSSLYNEKSLLRSLVVICQHPTEPKIVCSKLFDQLTCLRSLHLSKSSIEEIPKRIGKLIHLRYLNLSNNGNVKELPETLCGLYNLQTLDISDCANLQKLPQGMGNLINLRHLLNSCCTSLSYMPKSFERLTCLRSIEVFFISDGSLGSNACSLQCLKHFTHLQEIWITELGNVTVDKVEEVGFKNMKNLRDLGLDFEGRMDEKHELLFEVLQPHPNNLEKLWISNYRGSTFANWIMSLAQLRRLILDNCMNCEYLPPLGKLSSLEFLYVMKLNNVRRVGNEFLGIESGATSSSSSVLAFPKLKLIYFKDMKEWEDWNYEISERGEEDITVMPCLELLLMECCPKLKSLPNHLSQMTNLEEDIRECPLLEELQTTDSSSSSPPSVSECPPLEELQTTHISSSSPPMVTESPLLEELQTTNSSLSSSPADSDQDL